MFGGGPELYGESRDAVVGVGPVVEGAGYVLAGFVGEVVVDRDVRVAGDLGSPVAEFFEHRQVVLRQLRVGFVRVRPQYGAAERVVGVDGEDVFVGEQEIYLRRASGSESGYGPAPLSVVSSRHS